MLTRNVREDNPRCLVAQENSAGSLRQMADPDRSDNFSPCTADDNTPSIQSQLLVMIDSKIVLSRSFDYRSLTVLPQIDPIDVATSMAAHTEFSSAKGCNMRCGTTPTVSAPSLLTNSGACTHSSHHNDESETAVIPRTKSAAEVDESPDVASPRSTYIRKVEHR